MTTTAMDIIRRAQAKTRAEAEAQGRSMASAVASGDQVEAALSRAMAGFGMPELASMSAEDRELVAIGVLLQSILGVALGHNPNDGLQARRRQGVLEFLLARYDTAEAQS